MSEFSKLFLKGMAEKSLLAMSQMKFFAISSHDHCSETSFDSFFGSLKFDEYFWFLTVCSYLAVSSITYF